MTIITGGVVITGFTQFTANYVPEPPTVLTATWTTTVTNTVSLTFTEPTSPGSGPILSYSAASNPVGFTATIAANTNTFVIPGLSTTTYYVFNIYATNFAGNSILSTASNVVYGIYSSPIFLSSYAVPTAPTSISAIITSTNATSTPSALVKFLPGTSTIPAASYTVLANGTVAGVTTVVPTTSYSGYFNGSNAYLTIPAGTNLEFSTENFTVEMWVYPLATTNGSMLGNWTQNGAGDHGMKISYGRTVAGKFEFFYSSSGQSSPGVMVSASTYAANAWYHVAAVRIGSIVNLYVNGSSAVSGTYSGNMFQNYYWIGTENPGYNTTWFNGYISNVRLVKYLGVYTGAFTPPTGPLSITQSDGIYITAISAASTVTMLTLQNATSIVDNSSFGRSITVSGVTTSTNQPFDPFAYVVASNLSPVTSYTFRVYASNLVGDGALSTTSSAITTYASPGAAAYTFPGSYTWVAPANVTAVSVVAVGGGGGTYGNSYNVGGDSYFNINTLVKGGGGGKGSFSSGAPGTFVGHGGSLGGQSSRGGGGAGGYINGGGLGAPYGGSGGSCSGYDGVGGGGGGGALGMGPIGNDGFGGGGGGVGLFGLGTNGAGGISNTITGYGSAGGGGSDGLSGTNAGSANVVTNGGLFGGGMGGYDSGSYNYQGGAGGGLGYINSTTVIPGTSYNVQVGIGGPDNMSLGAGNGAVRIVWPGQIRKFPSTAVNCYANSTSSYYVPNAPTSVTAAALSATSVIVTFGAPLHVGGSVVTSYTAVSTPDNITSTTATAASSVIIVNGLRPLTSYTFSVYATNLYGNSTASSSLSTTTYIAAGSALYAIPGTYTWVRPSACITSVSVVAVGGGGSGGYSATSANSGATIGVNGSQAGGDSYFWFTTLVKGGGGVLVPCGNNYVGDGGGRGGSGYGCYSNMFGCSGYFGTVAGGGAGGYSGVGGTGSSGVSLIRAATAGTGGGGGGGTYSVYGSAGGGGVGVFGLGTNGAAGTVNNICAQCTGGFGGSGGLNGKVHGAVGSTYLAGAGGGGLFGGGGASLTNVGGNGGGTFGGQGGGLGYKNNIALCAVTNSYTVVVGIGGANSNAPNAKGGNGAVRIVWPGQIRRFPSNGVNQGWGNDSATIASGYVPNAPTITSAVASSGTAITVNFTSSSYYITPITSYTAVATTGTTSISRSIASVGPIVILGLTPLTRYTVSMYATNAYGSSTSSQSQQVTTLVTSGEAVFTTAGTYSWTAPANVTSVSVVAVGGGGGSDDGQCRGTVGSESYFMGGTVVRGYGGGKGSGYSSYNGGAGGTYVGSGGGGGGVGGAGNNNNLSGGGGGAGGYSGTGGTGATGTASRTDPLQCFVYFDYTASGGTGGAGGGGGYWVQGTKGVCSTHQGGGAVGLYGQGADGAAGISSYNPTFTGGGGGSGGASASPGTTGAAYGASPGGGVGGAKIRQTSGGGGGGLGYINNHVVTPGTSYTVQIGAGGRYSTGGPAYGGCGAVRIIWPGAVRTFPSTLTGPSSNY